MRTPLRGHRRGLYAAEIPDSAATVERGVAVQALAPETAVRRTDDVVVSWKRGEVAHDDDGFAGARFAQEADDARFGVVVIDPFETGAVEIELIERRRRSIERVQIGDPSFDARVLQLIQHPPFERI